MLKKALCLIFSFLLSLNSFAAVVSDNDGSAFITKAEFDSLKNNFQAQIDQYNTSIDSKIDGAIAGYLAGINLAKKSEMRLPYDNNNFWIYRNNGVNMPEINSRLLLHNFNNGTATQRFKLFLRADENFKINQVGAPPLWISEISGEADSELLYDGSLNDKVTMAVTETYDASNYWGIWRAPNRVGVYLTDGGTGLNLQTYQYERNPSSYGDLEFKMCMYHSSGVDQDSSGIIKVTNQVGGVDTIDQQNIMHFTKDSISSYVANVNLSQNNKFVPLAVKGTDALWCIQYNSTFPTLYRWSKSGIWQTCLENTQVSGTHYYYSVYGNSDVSDGRSVGQIRVGSGTKWFYGKNNMYTTAQQRNTTSSSYSTWWTPTTKQIVIAPHSGIIPASNLLQRIKTIDNNRIRPYAGIMLTQKSEGVQIEFKLTLQAKGIGSSGLVNTSQSYKVAASNQPFGDGVNNSKYLKINDATTNVVNLASNGTHSIKIEDIEKGDEVYFKIVPDSNVDVQVEISDCYITTE